MEAGWTEWVAKGRKTKDAACVKKKMRVCNGDNPAGIFSFSSSWRRGFPVGTFVVIGKDT